MVGFAVIGDESGAAPEAVRRAIRRAFDEAGLPLDPLRSPVEAVALATTPLAGIDVLVDLVPRVFAGAYLSDPRTGPTGLVVAVGLVADETAPGMMTVSELVNAGAGQAEVAGLGVIVSDPTLRRLGGPAGDVWSRVEIGTGSAVSTAWMTFPDLPNDELRGIPFGEPLVGHTGRVWWGAWGQVGGRPVLATGGDDRRVLLWGAGTDAATVLAGHTGWVSWGAWGGTADRPVLATGSHDSTVIRWNPATGSHDVLSGHNGQVWWGAWENGPSPSVLATGGSSGTVRVWEGDRPTDSRGSHSGGTRWGAWGTVGDQPVLATGGDDRTAILWLPDGRRIVLGHGAAVRWGAWAPTSGHAVLATGDESGTVTLWRDDENPGVFTEERHRLGGGSWWGAWTSAAGRPLLAAGGDNGDVVLLSTTSEPGHLPEQPARLSGHDSAVLCGAWARIDGRLVLATGDTGGTVRLWDPFARTEIAKPLAGHTGPVRWLGWAEVDGRPVLATGGFGNVLLWEVVTDRPVPRLPAYRSDTAHTVDELSRDRDASALAELITARTARPPLAVGLFGEWGEGKSHFLSLLWKEVDATARSGNPLAHDAVRQVRFNAWHYAETDLWASLVAELFAQLAAPPGGDAGTEQRRQSRLTAELVVERGVRERLRAARARHDELRDALLRAERDDDGSWAGLSDEQRAELRLLAGDRAEVVFRDAARTVASAHEGGRRWWRLLRGLRPATLAVLAAGAALTVGALVLVPVVAALPAVSTVAGVVALLRSTAVERAGAAWNFAVRAGEAQRERLRTAVDVAAAEVDALAREERDLTAAGQLAGLVTDRVAGTDYRGRLGVMTRIREDFEQMATLLAEADGDDEAGDTLPRIDRIIIYVDDLDRCPPRRVVEMLEAIHLLLAVELFVVVVAVDPRWLLRAVASHYRELLDAPGASTTGQDDDELWQSSPAQYLEKIFQVVLTLPPMDVTGYQRLLRTLVGTRDDQPPTPPAETPRPPSARAPDGPPAAPQANDHPRAVTGVRLPSARPVDRVDPLTLEPDELALLDILGPPLLVTTPRAVKRLANSYGLLTAIRRDHRQADLSSTGSRAGVRHHPYRAGLVLLAALVAYPALGPALLTHLHHTAAENPELPWTDYLDSLRPTRTESWANPADPVMTPATARRWRALLDGLREATEAAAGRGLPVPASIGAWREWVVPVGRLSFPAGRIVNGLARQRPLDESSPARYV